MGNGIEDMIVDMSMSPPSNGSMNIASRNEFSHNREFTSKDTYLRNKFSEIDIEVEDSNIKQNGLFTIFPKMDPEIVMCRGTGCDLFDPETIARESTERAKTKKKLLITIILSGILMLVEIFGGLKANSLSLFTDVAHLLVDVLGFAISLISLWAIGWEATPRKSFGFFRIEILGASISILLIWGLVCFIIYEAIHRFVVGPQHVNGLWMFGVASVGLVFNIIMLLVLRHDHGHGHGHGHDHGHGNGHHGHSHQLTVSTHDEDDIHHHTHEGVTEPHLSESNERSRRNINLQGAVLHTLVDIIQSIGVTVGGGLIWLNPNLKIVDLICTLLFSTLVWGMTLKMGKNICEVLMESTPPHIDPTSLETGILEMEEVVHVHELHIWSITFGKTILTCHVRINQHADANITLIKIIEYIKRVHKINHVTVQIER